MIMKIQILLTLGWFSKKALKSLELATSNQASEKSTYLADFLFLLFLIDYLELICLVAIYN